jgi:hypothetical protein
VAWAGRQAGPLRQGDSDSVLRLPPSVYQPGRRPGGAGWIPLFFSLSEPLTRRGSEPRFPILAGPAGQTRTSESDRRRPDTSITQEYAR